MVLVRKTLCSSRQLPMVEWLVSTMLLCLQARRPALLLDMAVAMRTCDE